MELSQEKIQCHLERVLSASVARVYYTSCQNRVAREANICYMHPFARFLFCISGRKHLRSMIDNANPGEFYLQPGEAIYAAPHNQLLELWDSAHEMFCAVFLRHTLRLLYISHDGIAPPPLPAPNPTLYYQTSRPINPVGNEIVGALNRAAMLAAPGNRAIGGELLLTALLLNIRADAALPQGAPKPHRQFLWSEVYDFVAEHFTRPDLTRELVAKRFHIHSAHVSRLFLQELGIGFMEYLNRQRFQLALELLRNPGLNINEITEACGFRYSSYFIHAFRRKFNMTPGSFREQLHRDPMADPLQMVTKV